MNTETILKETDSAGVYVRRRVHDDSGNLVSDERVKRDPVLEFTQPNPVSLDDVTGLASLSLSFQLRDFDGEARTDTGAIHFRLRERMISGDDGLPFDRQLLDGQLVLSLEFDAPGEYVLTIEPPFLADLQLCELLQVRVTG
jgi:hypothetical protein